MPKRNAQGAGTIRERKDGTWEARYTIGRDPGTGKQKQKSIYGKTQKEVLKKLQQVQNDVNTGAYIEPSKLTVGTWLDVWIKEYPGKTKERTRIEYKKHIEYRIKPALGNVQLTDLDTHTIQLFYNDCLRGSKGKKAIAPKTVRNIHGILHKALEQALELGYIRLNPSSRCKLPRVEKPDINPLDDEQIKAFLLSIQGHQFEILNTVDLFTGIRQGEILGLPWSAINFKAGTILISQQLQRIDGEYKIVSVKNDKLRTITPAPYVMRLLQQQKTKQAADKLRAGSAWQNEHNLVFTNELGRNIARQTAYSNYKRLLKTANIEVHRFHDLRHSYAVAALQSGDDIKTVQENLGHYSAAFTLDVYGHVSDRMKKESAQRMEQFIQGVKG